MKPPRLTPEALRDLRHIGDTSLEGFGPRQAERYVRRLHAAFLDLAEGRRTGRVLLDHRPLDLFLLVRVHYVVYRAESGGRILIVRILHSRMDLSSHL